MSMTLTYGKVFAVVTAASLVGMVMGGLFGLGAGTLAPKLFSHMIMWTTLEPVATAVVLGAIAGVLLGGGLGVFGIAVQTFAASRSGRADTD